MPALTGAFYNKKVFKVNKTRCYAAVTLLLTALAGLSLPAIAQDGPPGPFSTTTTLSISGKAARGATVTLTASVTGNQFVLNNSAGVCNAYMPNTITIYAGSTAIGSVALTTANATASITDSAVLVNTYDCTYEDQYWTTATSYTITYLIPKNVPSINFHAVFTPAAESYSLSSQSPTAAYRFPSALPAVISLLFNN